MTVESFTRMIHRIREQIKIRYILLYSFSEPLLHPQIGEIVREAKRHTKRVMISTNLSNPERVEACMDAGLDELRISFSGFKYGEYFHTGRNMAEFILACNQVSDLIPQYPKTRVSLIFHEYATTLPELPEVKDFARSLRFNLIEEPAFFIGWEKIVDRDYTPADLELISHLVQTPEEALTGLKRQEYCYYQTRQLVFDANGDSYLCRHVLGDKFITGNILKDSVKDIRRAMMAHDFCPKCKDHKLNVFAP
jgi:MoaA/NifB/PqqE/SkfB family radical SAM enzyme